MKPKPKAHTQHPAQPQQHHASPPKDITYVLGWLLLPVALVCLAIYRWRVMRARMGYRTVRYEG